MERVQHRLKRPAQLVADQVGTNVGSARTAPGANLNCKPDTLPDGGAIEGSEWMVRVRRNGTPARGRNR